MWRSSPPCAESRVTRAAWVATAIAGGLLIVSLIVLTAFESARTHACGRSFPNRFLSSGDRAVLEAPAGDFATELDRITGRKTPPRRSSGDARQSTIDADLADLEAALQAAGRSGEALSSVLDGYRALRGDIRKHLEWREQVRRRLMSGRARYRKVARARAPANPGSPMLTPPRSPLSSANLAGARRSTPPSRPEHKPLAELSVPAGTPREFELYVEGAMLWHRGWRERARKVWRSLLELPPHRRQYRSTWAAYMIGRSYRGSDPERVREWFQRTRDLANDGFKDTLGLAASAAGEEASIELEKKNYAAALALYLEQHRRGDSTARPSILITFRRLFRESDADLVAVARNQDARRLLTIYLMSRESLRFGSANPRYGGDGLNQGILVWGEALDRVGVNIVADADRLAWTLYRGGDYERAERWLDRADPYSPVSLWLRAKLLLREGRVEEAIPVLAGAARGFPLDEAWSWSFSSTYEPDGRLRPSGRVRGELAVIHVSRGDFTRALELLLSGGYWWDAAYVAENVLSADELLAFLERVTSERVDREQAESVVPRTRNRAGEDGRYTKLRYLLARRLTRMGRWQDARPYYPEKWQARLDEYIATIRRGNDPELGVAERAEALWEAAKIARHDGMELLGTEVGPDWKLVGGTFNFFGTAKARFETADSEIVPASAAERERVEAHRPEFTKRFHYRYIAAEHAWQAAELMPDETDETADVLCTAGSWLKVQDPKTADRFYKALVWRCRSTELGRKADELRWFPR